MFAVYLLGKNRDIDVRLGFQINNCKLFLVILFITTLLTSAGEAATRLFDKSYALVVGIDEYDTSYWPALSYGKKDARAVGKLLEDQGFEVSMLLGKEATRDNILWTLSEEIAPKLTGHDRVVVFFSGHGETREVGWRDYGYVIPYDGTERFPTWISMAEMREISAQMLKARHQLFVFDSCYGGSIGAKAVSNRESSGRGPRHIEKVSGNRARQFLTAGGKNEQVLAGGPHGYSYFTGYLLDALNGKADRDEDNYVTMSELSAYLLSAASTWSHTPRWGILPEHEQGEFWFQVPSSIVTTRVVELKLPDQAPDEQKKSAPPGDPRRPEGLSHPQGPMDDLEVIEGLGPAMRAKLQEMGIFHYWQIAEWTPENLAWFDQHPHFSRYVSPLWVEEAQRLMQERAGG